MILFRSNRFRLLITIKYYWWIILNLITVIILFYVTFHVVLPNWCRSNLRWCNPKLHDFFDVRIPNDFELDDENHRRSEDAWRFLTGRPNRTWIDRSAGATDQSILTMTVIAKRRPYPIENGRRIELRYLTQVTAEILKSIDRLSPIIDPIDFFLCDIDDEPEKFDEMRRLTELSIPSIKRPKVTAIPDQSDPLDRIFEREKSDYEFCLRAAMERTTADGHVIVFQDDALPADGLFDRFVRSVRDQMIARSRRLTEIGYGAEAERVYVKFYHPEAYRKLPWYIHAIAYSTLLVWPLFVLKRYVWTIILLVYFSILFWCFGHETVAHIRYLLTNAVYLVHQESCCIPAVLYTRQSAAMVAEYLTEHVGQSGYAVDHMLDEMDTVSGLMTDTNLIRHIGRYTTLRRHPVRSDLW